MALTFTMFIILVALICGFLANVKYHVRRFQMYKLAAQFPGPLALPLVGNALYVIGKVEDVLNKLLSLTNAYPSPFRCWFGNILMIGVYDAEQLKIILHSPNAIEKDDIYKLFEPVVGTGLFTAPGTKWQIHRKVIAPTFNTKIIETFVEIFATQSRIMVQQLRSRVDSGEFDIFYYLSLCTFDIVCETAMGVSTKAQTSHNCSYEKSVERIGEITFERLVKLWLHPDSIFYRTQQGREYRQCVEVLHRVMDDVIRKKKIDYSKEKDEQEIKAEDHQQNRRAFLDLLMELNHEGARFSDEELRDEVTTMIIGEKVHKELCDIYGNDDTGEKLVTIADVHRMEYLERVIKETLRLFPIVPIIGRRITKDLNIGQYTLPRGCTAVLGIIKLHRNDKYWKNPMKFDPDRFLPEETAKRHPYCYIPFSAGPRNCVGMKYGMVSMKTLLATVLRRYIIKKCDAMPIEDIKLRVNCMLKPVNPIKIRIGERTTNK